MKKIIIYGAGFLGQSAYYKMKHLFEVLYFVDDEKFLDNKELFGIPIISEAKLKEVYSSEIDIIISTNNYFQISTQLIAMGIKSYYVLMEGFLYHNCGFETMMPVELSKYPPLKKETGEKCILYMENIPSIRTHKIAELMKKAGYHVYLLYMMSLLAPEHKSLTNIYNKIFTFYTANEIINFIKGSDFDMIHSSDDAAILTNIGLLTSKHIVYDIGNRKELLGDNSVENTVLESIANTKSNGNIYSSEHAAMIAKKKYELENKEILIWNPDDSVQKLISFYKRVKQRKITQ